MSEELEQSGERAESSGFTPRELGRIWRKNSWLMIVTAIVVAMAGVFWTLGQVRIYQSSALLRFNPDPPKPLGKQVELVNATIAPWSRKEFYETEFRVIKSSLVTHRVVTKLGLNADPDFLGIPPNKRAGFRPILVEDAARLLSDRLVVEPVKDSSLAYVKYEDSDPNRARLVLDTVVRVYLDQNIDSATLVSTSAVEWLHGQLDTLKDALEKSESELNEFRVKNDVLSVSLEDRTNLTVAELEAISRQRTQLNFQRIELSARLAEFVVVDPANPLNVGSSSQVNANALVGSLRSAYADTYRQIEEMEVSYGESHPKVLALKARLDVTAKLIGGEVANLREALMRDIRGVDRQLGDLKKRENELKKDAHDVQTLAMPFNVLLRRKANNEKLYTLVLERARETELERVMNFNNVSVVDTANMPHAPIRPDTRRNAALSLAVGVIVAFGLALGRELMDRSLRTRADVEALTNAPFLGTVPEAWREGELRNLEKAPTRLDLAVHDHPSSTMAEVMRLIRTNILFSSPDAPHRRIVVTSAIPSEGKSTIATSLAIVFAQMGQKTLLVDTDLRRPRIHRTFDTSNELGVSLAVAGQTTLDECIVETSVPHLSLLPAGSLPPAPVELLQSQRFKEVVEELSSKFDRIIFDSPPTLPVADSCILSAVTDGVIVVARSGKTARTLVAQALRRLRDARVNIIGVVLNGVDIAQQRYEGEYGYYYSSKYRTKPTEPSAA